MEFLILLAFFFVVESSSNNLNNQCAKYMEWDPVLKLCRGCPIDTKYNETLSKCIDMENVNRTCNAGYKYDLLEKKCLDIDECNQTIDICQLNEYCRNLPGSYKCQVKEYCGQGYEFSTVTYTCMDIDECAQSSRYCDSNLVCENVSGSFICRHPCPPKKQFYWNSACQECREGYRFNSVTNECEDIDECVGPFKLQCESFKEICVKKPGLSKCITQCSGGTIKYNNNCFDIDECSENKHNCTNTQRCTNYYGYFTCSEIQCNENEDFNNHTKECFCKPGFKKNLYTERCEGNVYGS